MMKSWIWMALMGLLVTSCAHLPKIIPAYSQSPETIANACSNIFPQGKHQFLHRIEATPPNGQTQTMLGLSQIFEIVESMEEAENAFG